MNNYSIADISLEDFTPRERGQFELDELRFVHPSKWPFVWASCTLEIWVGALSDQCAQDAALRAVLTSLSSQDVSVFEEELLYAPHQSRSQLGAARAEAGFDVAALIAGRGILQSDPARLALLFERRELWFPAGDPWLGEMLQAWQCAGSPTQPDQAAVSIVEQAIRSLYAEGKLERNAAPVRANLERYGLEPVAALLPQVLQVVLRDLSEETIITLLRAGIPKLEQAILNSYPQASRNYLIEQGQSGSASPAVQVAIIDELSTAIESLWQSGTPPLYWRLT